MNGRQIVVVVLLALAVLVPVAVLFFSPWDAWTFIKAAGACAILVLAAVGYSCCCVAGDYDEAGRE